jgi:hypothetical protein
MTAQAVVGVAVCGSDLLRRTYGRPCRIVWPLCGTKMRHRLRETDPVYLVVAGVGFILVVLLLLLLF